jgi:dihydroneopterin aldolase
MKAEIELVGLDFFSYHGFYEEERKIGNRYTIDIKVLTNLSFNTSTPLESTINYEILGKIAQEESAKSCLLLEDLAFKIAQRILKQFESALETTISVSKHNPPIGIICEKSKVTITLNSDECLVLNVK